MPYRPWLLAACLLCGPPLSASDISVTLDSPDPFSPARGEVVIDAVVVADETIERVVFYLDGLVVGELRQPPYRFTVDVGDGVGEHRFQVLAYGASGATGSDQVTTPGIDIQEEVLVTLQQVYVTVSRQGERVLDLTRDRFEIFDEGNRQRILTFERGDVPFTAVAMVDSSTSMEGSKLETALAGAAAFFGGMRPLDEGRLLVFSDRLLHTTPFSTFPEVLTAGLSGIRARGGTAIADHLYLALKQLEERQGRRVVILLSDGVDSHSVLKMTDVLDVARRSQALIYWLRLPYGDASDPGSLPALGTSWRNPEQYRRRVALLETIVAESGGRTVLLSSFGEIQAAFTSILAELRDQYVLGYAPAVLRHDGSWREVEVRLDDRSLETRSRGGYLDE